MYSKPTPSLCDTCTHSYIFSDGAISMGNKTYPQRYCSTPGAACEEKGKYGSIFVGISTGGFDKCDKYQLGDK